MLLATLVHRSLPPAYRGGNAYLTTWSYRQGLITADHREKMWCSRLRRYCATVVLENVERSLQTVECVNRWHTLTVKAGSTLLPSSPQTPAFCCSTFDLSITPPLHSTPPCGDTAEPSILRPCVPLASLLRSSCPSSRLCANTFTIPKFSAGFLSFCLFQRDGFNYFQVFLSNISKTLQNMTLKLPI